MLFWRILYLYNNVLMLSQIDVDFITRLATDKLILANLQYKLFANVTLMPPSNVSQRYVKWINHMVVSTATLVQDRLSLLVLQDVSLNVDLVNKNDFINSFKLIRLQYNRQNVTESFSKVLVYVITWPAWCVFETKVSCQCTNPLDRKEEGPKLLVV